MPAHMLGSLFVLKYIQVESEKSAMCHHLIPLLMSSCFEEVEFLGI